VDHLVTFQYASALLWLLPLGGIIIALYLLKMRRRDLRVPATFLWPAMTEEIRANSLFQRLRFSWLLILQLLAMLLVVGALARPQTMQRGLTGKVSVLVIDTSASMAATDVQPSRFDEAKRLARAAIQSAAPGDRIAILEAGPTPRVISPLSSDPARQLAALDQLKGTDAESDVGEALRLASSLVGNEQSARIVLLSDGDFAPVTDFSKGKATLVYQNIGAIGDNLAITALGTAEASGGRQLFCGIKNYGLVAMSGAVTIYADGKIINSEKLQVAPGQQWGDTMSVAADARVFEAKLDAPDVLKSDNYAVALANPGASLHVLLIAKGDFFMERALALDPRVTLDRATELPPDEQGGSGGSKYDVIVFDGVQEESVRSRGVLTMGAAGDSSPVTTSGQSRSPKFISQEDKPLLKGVDLSPVYIDSIEKVSPKNTGEVLAQSSGGPLVVTSSSPTQRKIYLAFKNLDSDFPLQVGFPIFIANALDFFSDSQGLGVLSVKTGSPFALPIGSSGTLSEPDGTSEHIDPTGSVLVVRGTKRVGQYTLQAGGQKRTIYATLKSDRESNVVPVKNVSLGGGEVKATRTPLRFADFWRPLVLLCLIVLAGEWWLFARRS
jgi:hypothetical protein